MVKRSIEQNLGMKNFKARSGNFVTRAVVENQRVKQREQRTLGDCWQWKAKGQCSKGDNCSFGHDLIKRAKSTQPNSSPRSSTLQSVKNASRTRGLGGRSPSGRMSRLQCKDCFNGTCTTPFCEKWHPPECLFNKSENGCQVWGNVLLSTRQVDEQLGKRSPKNGDKNTVAMLNGASMHMISKKDSNSAELETVTTLRSPTTVFTSNGEVQKNEEATVYVKELGIILDNESPRRNASSFIARKALRWKRIFLWMDQWSKTTSHLKRDSNAMQYGELRSYFGSRLVSEFVLRFWSVNFKDTFKTGDSLFQIFFMFVFVTNHSNINW